MTTLETVGEAVADPAGSSTSTSTTSSRALVARAWLVAVVGAGALAVLLDAVSARFVPGTSDGATVILEGQAIASGNLGLHGWSLSLDSFWSLDAVANAVVVALSGLRPNVVNLVPAILAALVVVLGATLAIDRRRGLSAALSAGTVLVILGLPSPGLAFHLLQGPWHVGTALCCLIAFASVSDGRLRWRWAATVLLLALAVIGDVMAILFGVAPLLVAGIVVAARTRRVRAGAPAFLAAALSLPVALLIRLLAQAFGTFVIVNRNLPVRLSQVAHNLHLLSNRVGGLFGIARTPTAPANGPLVFELFRGAGLVVVLLGLFAGLLRLCRGAALGRTGWCAGRDARAPSWRLDDLLTLACGADLVAYLFGSASNNPEYTKYLTPGVIFAVVLAGRLVGRLVDWIAARSALADPIGASQSDERLRPSRRSRVAALGVPRLALAAVGLTLAVAYATQVSTILTRPTAPQPAQALGAFLASRDLTLGIGDYWSSSIVTVETSGAVVVRPVTTSPKGLLRRYERQSAASWYEGKRFQFFVYNAARPWRNVNVVSATRTFGPPSGIYPIGAYRVLVWNHPLTVSTAVPSYGSPLQIFWSPPGGPRSSSTTTSTVATTTSAPAAATTTTSGATTSQVGSPTTTTSQG